MDVFKSTRPHIGIVAGTADGASLCYRSLCYEAVRTGRPAQPEITMHTFPLEWYLSLIERDDWAGVAALMSRSAGKLVQAGAELIICPNNTLHRAFDLVVSAVPWLHIVEPVTAEIRRMRLQRVGLLGTPAVMEGRIYHPQLTQAGIEVVLPEAQERSRLHHIIRTELIHGQYTATSRSCVQEIIGRLAARGTEAVILGCTELPLLLADEQSALPLLDSTRLLAKAALQRCAPAATSRSALAKGVSAPPHVSISQ
ncbi:MAG TPA: amino acid racemase [Nitrospira sp.]|nr:amino acid racemase [Nitrospira sp.]